MKTILKSIFDDEFMTGLLQIFEVAFAHAVNCHNTDVSRCIYCEKYICLPQAQIMTVTKVGNDTDNSARF